MLNAQKTYTNCEELPLYNFIKIAVFGDFKYLLVDISASVSEDLSIIWMKILEEYNSLCGDTHYLHNLSLLKDITILNNKLNIIQSAVTLLSNFYSIEVCDLLKGYGFDFDYTEESLINDLKLTVSSAKRMLIQKQEAETEYMQLNSNEEKASEMDFINLVVQLSRFIGFKIETKSTNVLEFIAYMNQFKLETKPKSASNG